MGQCWLCGSEESDEFLPASFSGSVSSNDLKISDAHYGRTARIVTCKACGFRYAEPLPAADLIKLYTELKDEEYDADAEARSAPLQALLKTALKLRPQARTLLDIGAGTGLLCQVAAKAGLSAIGVEPSLWGVKVAAERHGVTLLPGVFPHPELRSQRFDLITLVDVIEHVTNPMILLEEASRALAPDGLAVIVTPDADSLAARLLKNRWWHYRLAHVSYFNRRNMLEALDRVDLQPELVRHYSWRFPLGYVMERLENYLPVSPLNRLLAGNFLGQRLLRKVIPVNPLDSYIFFAGKAAKR